MPPSAVHSSHFAMTHNVYLGLGSNLGDREATLNAAISEIGKLVGEVVRRSAFYVTEPWGFASDNAFVNAVVCCQTTLSPRRVLEATQQIEIMLGRTRKSVGGRYSDRTIDIDILLYDDISVDEPDLVIPHPLMRQRDFVMRPLREILSPLQALPTAEGTQEANRD